MHNVHRGSPWYNANHLALCIWFSVVFLKYFFLLLLWMIDYVTDWLIGLYVHVLLCVCFRHALISLRDKQGAHVALSPTMPANTPTWVLRTLHVVISLLLESLLPSSAGPFRPLSIFSLSLSVCVSVSGVCLHCALFFFFFWHSLDENSLLHKPFFFSFFFLTSSKWDPGRKNRRVHFCTENPVTEGSFS